MTISKRLCPCCSSPFLSCVPVEENKMLYIHQMNARNSTIVEASGCEAVKNVTRLLKNNQPADRPLVELGETLQTLLS